MLKAAMSVWPRQRPKDVIAYVGRPLSTHLSEVDKLDETRRYAFNERAMVGARAGGSRFGDEQTSAPKSAGGLNRALEQCMLTRGNTPNDRRGSCNAS